VILAARERGEQIRAANQKMSGTTPIRGLCQILAFGNTFLRVRRCVSWCSATVTFAIMCGNAPGPETFRAWLQVDRALDTPSFAGSGGLSKWHPPWIEIV
jgi:hypothetical protein